MARKPVKLVFRRRPAIMAIVLVAVICSTIAVVALRGSLAESKSQYELMRLQAAALEAANQELNHNIADLGTVDSAIEIAEDELGLVLPGTIVFIPGN